MPTLKIFKRTWKVAQDDLVNFSVFAGSVRLTLVLAAIILLIIRPSWLNLPDEGNMVLFIITGVISCLHVLIYFIIAGISGTGGIMETSKRKFLEPCVVVHFVFMPLEFIFLCLSIWRIVEINKNTSEDTFAIFIAIICWCSILLFFNLFEFFSWMQHYDKHGAVKYQFYETFLYGNGENKSDEEKIELIRNIRKISNNKWTKFIRNRLTDYDHGDEDGKEAAVNEAADALADYLTDLDMTQSDISTGLLLLRWQTTQWVGGKSKVHAGFVLDQTEPDTSNIAAQLIESNDPFKNLANNWLHISRLRQYSHFVNASYGWLYYCAENIFSCTAMHRLCQKLSFKNKAADDKQVNIEDGINGPGGCLCAGRNAYLAAFMEMSGLATEDILVFEIADAFYEAALMLVIDDSTQAIVLIVRGTLSGDDTLVDLLAVGEPLREEDKSLPESEQFVAHGGMVRTAKKIAERVIKERWIERAREKRPDYPLVVCGHSLGAGLTSLLSVLLKPNFPEIKAYAFSPPGALMNQTCSEATRENLVSVIYGYDLVGRLGGPSMEDLRARLLHAVTVCRVPKYILVATRLTILFLRCFLPCCGLPRIGDMDSNLTIDIREKLINPDLEDVYSTDFGSKFKRNEADMTSGVPRVDRLLEKDRSLMKWKKPDATQLLRLPRPYPKRLYPKEMADGTSLTFDVILGSIQNPRCGARLLHLFEVDSEFSVPGVQPYNKRNYMPPPIALWKPDYNAFETVLIHPKMLFNHSPIFVSTALDRLYANITWPDQIFPEVGINTYQHYFKPLKGVFRKSEENDKTYCRVRVLSS